MKKVLGIILTGVIIISCGEGKHTPIPSEASENASNTSTTATSTVSATVSATATSTTATSNTVNKEELTKGMELIAKSDCLTCHKLNEKIIGPAYKEVAKKYAYTPANVTMLAGKIKNGGSGNWGAIPMTGHASLSQADAASMVKYILNLK
jgi:cytochrome c